MTQEKKCNQVIARMTVSGSDITTEQICHGTMRQVYKIGVTEIWETPADRYLKDIYLYQCQSCKHVTVE